MVPVPSRRSSVNGVAKRELDEKKTDEEPWKRGRSVDSGVFNLGAKLREVTQEITGPQNVRLARVVASAFVG